MATKRQAVGSVMGAAMLVDYIIVISLSVILLVAIPKNRKQIDEVEQAVRYIIKRLS